MEKLGLNLITSEKMIEFINKLNFIKKAQHNFKKTSIDEWYKEWEEYMFCRV
jgi:hypothetical protein